MFNNSNWGCAASCAIMQVPSSTPQLRPYLCLKCGGRDAAACSDNPDHRAQQRGGRGCAQLANCSSRAMHCCSQTAAQLLPASLSQSALPPSPSPEPPCNHHPCCCCYGCCGCRIPRWLMCCLVCCQNTLDGCLHKDPALLSSSARLVLAWLPAAAADHTRLGCSCRPLCSAPAASQPAAGYVATVAAAAAVSCSCCCCTRLPAPQQQLQLLLLGAVPCCGAAAACRRPDVEPKIIPHPPAWSLPAPWRPRRRCASC